MYRYQLSYGNYGDPWFVEGWIMNVRSMSQEEFADLVELAMENVPKPENPTFLLHTVIYLKNIREYLITNYNFISPPAISGEFNIKVENAKTPKTFTF